MLDDAAQAVPVCSNNNLFPLFQLGNDYIVPVGQSSFDGQLQGLEHRKFFGFRLCTITRIFDNGVIKLVPRFHGWWWSVERPSPDLDLFLAIFCSGFCFVHSGETSIVAFVESPRFVYRNTFLTNFFQDRAKSDLSTGQRRGVSYVKSVTRILKSFACSQSFAFSCTFLNKIS